MFRCISTRRGGLAVYIKYHFVRRCLLLVFSAAAYRGIAVSVDRHPVNYIRTCFKSQPCLACPPLFCCPVSLSPRNPPKRTYPGQFCSEQLDTCTYLVSSLDWAEVSTCDKCRSSRACTRVGSRQRETLVAMTAITDYSKWDNIDVSERRNACLPQQRK